MSRDTFENTQCDFFLVGGSIKIQYIQWNENQRKLKSSIVKHVDVKW
jgi:hypothetical protein